MPELNKLSDLILEGCKVSKQTRGEFILETGDGCFSCALGAAYIGATGNRKFADHDETGEVVRAILKKTGVNLYGEVEHPMNSQSRLSLFDIIVDLNDMRDWKRTQIAEWLKRIGL